MRRPASAATAFVMAPLAAAGEVPQGRSFQELAQLRDLAAGGVAPVASAGWAPPVPEQPATTLASTDPAAGDGSFPL